MTLRYGTFPLVAVGWVLVGACKASSATPGPTRLRACDPSASECDGNGCALLTSRHATVFPNHTIDVCD